MKVALCIDKTDCPVSYGEPVPGVFGILPDFLSKGVASARLVDRALCETDETLVQLLPYIVIMNERGDVLRYTRGGAGGESRLHGNYSIGLGGHVDIAPSTQDELLSVLRSEAARELQEEIGLVANPLRIRFLHAIVDGTNSVGRVHLGLLAIYMVSVEDSEIMKFEDAICDGKFVPLRSLVEEPETFGRLENWSKAVAAHLTGTYLSMPPPEPTDTI